MKQFVFFIAFILFLQPSFSQVNDDISFFANTYDKNFIRKKKIDKISIKMFNEGQFSSISIYDFDSSGFLTNLVILDSLGEKISEFKFKVNQNGDVIARETTDYELKRTYTVNYFKTYLNEKLIRDSSSDLPVLSKYTYNIKKQLVETDIISNYWTRVREVISNIYDNENRLIEVRDSLYDNNARTSGSLKSHRLLYYNLKGKIIKEDELVTGLNSEMLNEGTVDYTYNENGNLIRKTRQFASSEIYTYTNDGLISSKKTILDVEDKIFNTPNFKSTMEFLYSYSFRE